MITISRTSATALFRAAVYELIERGVFVTRGKNYMIEFPGPVALEMLGVGSYLVLDPVRRINPWVSLAEFPWLIAGRNDIDWLSPYLPRARDFSDDGLTWRAGYGPRLRGRYDPLAYVVGELRAHPHSRRAMLVLWDPAEDQRPGSKDYPCTDWLSFQRRPNGQLGLTVGMRSNDLWWGWSGVNVVNWSLLLAAVADWTGLRAGVYTHISDNLHVYRQRHGEQMGQIAEGAGGPEIRGLRDRAPDTFRGSLETFTTDCVRALTRIEMRRAEVSPAFPAGPVAGPNGEMDWLSDWEFFMELHRFASDHAALGRALEEGFGDRRPDWTTAALAWAASREVKAWAANRGAKS